MVSWTFNTQVNKNNVFHKNAAEYFKDNAEIAAKFKNKDYHHIDIKQLMIDYNNWKLN